MKRDSCPQRRLIVLGSTGSIGVNTLAVVQHLRRAKLFDFEVVGLAAGGNAKGLSQQAAEFDVPHVALADADRANEMQGGAQRWVGAHSAAEMVQAVARPGDLVVGAMVGSAGLPATLAAIDRGCDIALANKETLVAAGSLVMPRAAAAGIRILPVDSEHNAILQCLASGRSIDEVKRIVITASGGPFRSWPLEKMMRATAEEALNHPTWNMGPKITIDSATMTNKALEIIEAKWLFGLRDDQIGVVVHPQSIVHSFVEFVDGSVIAQLSPPDMRLPIQYALTWPNRIEGIAPRLDWSAAWNLTFEPPDDEAFPALALGRECAARGGSCGAVFNAAVTVLAEIFRHVEPGTGDLRTVRVVVGDGRLFDDRVVHLDWVFTRRGGGAIDAPVAEVAGIELLDGRFVA